MKAGHLRIPADKLKKSISKKSGEVRMKEMKKNECNYFKNSIRKA